MASVSGRVSTVTATSASGEMEKLKVMGFTLGKTAIGTKGSGRIVSSMGKGRIFFRMVTYILAIMMLGNQMVTVLISGETGLPMWEISVEALSQVKESGKKMKVLPQISMKDISTQI